MESWMIGGIAGGVAGGLGVLALGLLLPRKKCPDCGELFPRFSQPKNSRQALWGGATCAHCGCEVDRRGRKIEPEERR